MWGLVWFTLLLPYPIMLTSDKFLGKFVHVFCVPFLALRSHEMVSWHACFGPTSFHACTNMGIMRKTYILVVGIQLKDWACFRPKVKRIFIYSFFLEICTRWCSSGSEHHGQVTALWLENHQNWKVQCNVYTRCNYWLAHSIVRLQACVCSGPLPHQAWML